MILKKIIIIIPLIFVLIIINLFFKRDDNLSDESMSLYKNNEISESALYLLGIFADEKENPIDEGKKLLVEVQRSIDDGFYKGFFEYSFNVEEYYPKGEIFCDVQQSGCIDKLFNADIDIDRLLNRHETLMERSTVFLDFDEFQILEPRIISYESFEYLLKAERIKVLEAILKFKRGDIDLAVTALVEQFRKLRYVLALHDDITKQYFLPKLSEILDVLSVILSENDRKILEITNLNSSEKSFFTLLSQEFKASKDLILELNGYNLFQYYYHDEILERTYPDWLQNMLYLSLIHI